MIIFVCLYSILIFLGMISLYFIGKNKGFKEGHASGYDEGLDDGRYMSFVSKSIHKKTKDNNFTGE